MKIASYPFKIVAIGYLLFCCSLTMVAASDNLTASKDSLVHLLNAASDPSRRLELLTHLSDIGLIQDDYTYTERLWEQAVESGDQEAMFISVRSLALRHLNLCQLDSADVWIRKARTHLQGKPREIALQYLGMMYDIRDLTQRKELAQKLVEDSLIVYQSSNPYPYMRRLYDLAAVATIAEGNKNSLRLRSCNSYLKEGLKIAYSIPLEEDYLFKAQFLLGLSGAGLEYIKQLMALYKDYRQLPKIKERVFLSHQIEIAAIARILCYGHEIGRKQMDYYFGEFNRMIKLYPQDVAPPLDFYYYYVAQNYYDYIKDYSKGIACCDSVIRTAPKYGMDNSSYYKTKSLYLASLNRWQEAYQTVLAYQTIKDSIDSQHIADELTELQTRYNVSRLELEKANLISGNQRVYVVLTSLLALILAGWLLYVYHTLRNTRHLKQNLEMESRKALESEKMKTLFMNSMSHEVRTPLNAIQGFSGIILSGEIDEDMKSAMKESIEDNVAQLTNLLDDMLEISQLGCTTDRLPVAEVPIGEVCEKCMKMERQRLDNPDIVYRFENQCVSDTYLTNRKYITKAICNLLANANKFTRQGSILLTCSEDASRGRFILSVSDTGMGIPADKQEWVFETFTKINDFAPGIGLGLYVCREIVEHLGGEIYIDSAYTQGTRVVIELPNE